MYILYICYINLIYKKGVILNVSYEYYRVFYYVVKYKNFTLAAEALHNNQPNISRTIKLLESELGCKLISRSNRGISLTPEGERLYIHVKAAVEHIMAAEEEISRSAHFQEGSISIGTSETALNMVLLPALNIFKKKYPKIHIRILNHLSDQAISSVKNGLVDFAVVVNHIAVEKPLSAYTVAEFEEVLIGGENYKNLQNRELSVKELVNYPIVSLTGNTITHGFYEKFFYDNGLFLNPEIEAATIDQILPLVKNNLGIGFISEVLAKKALENKEVFKLNLKEKIPVRKVYFIENKNFPLSIAAKELKHLMVREEGE